MSFLNKAKDGAQNSGGNGDSDSGTRGVEGIDVDFDTTPFVRMSPTTFVTGVFPEGEGNPLIRFKNPQYNEDRLDQGYLGAVLDDPEAVVSEEDGTDGTVILQTNEQDSTDYRVFDSNDDQTSVVDGMGVKVGSGGNSRLYEGEFVDELPAERIILTVSGASSKNVAKRLDKRGGLAADMDEQTGDTNGGLIEYCPDDMRDDEDFTSRYSRDPEVKAALLGSRVGIFLARREELDSEDTGYGDEHTDTDEASYGELVADQDRPERGMYWYVVFDVENEEEVAIEVTDEEIDGYTYLHPEWDRYDPSLGGIPNDQWSFVEEYVEMAEAGDVDTDEDTIRANIEENAGDFDASPETDSMVSAIRNRV